MRYVCFIPLFSSLGILLPTALSSRVQAQSMPPSIAQPASAEAVPAEAGSKGDVDHLLTALKRERDPQAANRIASDIMALWADSHSATVNLLIQWADTAIAEKRNAAALDFLDQAIVLKPDNVAGWNRRATLHYTMGNYRKSVADINRVLALEPRHFGALAGLAAILGENSGDETAMKAWERYLDIYPADRDAQAAVTKLSEKLAGSRI
ncbi:MAG: hypothetical protein ACOH2J_17770 [Allorhizobium sp.]